MTEAAAAPQGKAAIIKALCEVMAEVGAVARKAKTRPWAIPT